MERILAAGAMPGAAQAGPMGVMDAFGCGDGENEMLGGLQIAGTALFSEPDIAGLGLQIRTVTGLMPAGEMRGQWFPLAAHGGLKKFPRCGSTEGEVVLDRPDFPAFAEIVSKLHWSVHALPRILFRLSHV